MPRLALRLIALLLALAATGVSAQDAAPAPDAALRSAFVADASEKYGLTADEIDAWLAQSEYRQSIVDAMSRPAEAVKPWKHYRPIFISDRRIADGQAFLAQHRAELDKVAADTGVPAEMIVAIIGVETRYGANKGRNRVVDALATLGFDYPPRAPFFRKELREFLALSKEAGLDPLATFGSYAGAMGYPQFMPSSWRKLAVDFDGDGRRDLINNPVDAIGSVANYFQANGWQTGAPVGARARIVNQDYDGILSKELATTSTLGEIAKKGLVPREEGAYLASEPASALRLQGNDGGEFWLTFTNFYVITKYNRSTLYAMAVWQLSEQLLAARTAAQAELPPAQPLNGLPATPARPPAAPAPAAPAPTA